METKGRSYLKLFLAGALLSSFCQTVLAQGNLACISALATTDVDHSDYVRQDPRGARQMVDQFTSAGLLLGPVHSYALRLALLKAGLISQDALDEDGVKRALLAENGDQPKRTAVHRSYKDALNMLNQAPSPELSEKIAHSTMEFMGMIISRPENFANPETHLNFARQQGLAIGISTKRFLQVQNVAWKLDSSAAQNAFYEKLLRESNPLMLRMIYARTAFAGDHALRLATLAAIPTAFAWFPDMVFGWDPRLMIFNVLLGLGGVISSVTFYGSHIDKNVIFEKATALPGNMIRRALGKLRLNRYVKSQMRKGALQDDSDIIEGKAEEDQQLLLESAVSSESQSFDRAGLEALQPALDLSNLDTIGDFGKNLPNIAGELADRFQAIGEEKSKNIKDLERLTSDMTSAKGNAKMTDLREALNARLTQLGVLQKENGLLLSDLDLLKQKVAEHLQEIASKKDGIPSSRTDLQKELNSITGELSLVDNLLGALSEQSQNLSLQMIEERDLIRQVRSAGTAKTIVAGRSAQDIGNSKISVEKLSALYKKAFADGGIYGN